MPALNVELYAGDSAHDGFTRAQSNTTIECTNQAINDYIAMSYTDLQSIYKTMLECKQWSAETKLVSSKEVYKQFEPQIKHFKEKR